MKKTALIISLCVVLLAALVLGFVYFNQFHLIIQLEREELIYQEYGEVFQPDAVQIYLRGDALYPLELKIDNCSAEVLYEIPEDQLGMYSVTYTAEFLYWKGSAAQTVHVIDTQCPVITLEYSSEDSFTDENKFNDPGYSATDNFDGDISDRIVRIETPGLVTYAVVDSSGNPCYAEREIPYFDTTPPVIELQGGQEYKITVGTVYTEPGYTASDDTDGDITESVLVQGEVDWLTPGIYPIEYQVADSCNNSATLVRNVTVEAAEWPDTQWPERKTIYLTFDDGPGPYTKTLLNVLDRYGVKATFFVVDSGYDALMGEIVRRGHSIGIHSVTHNYGQIYSSPEAYFADLYEMQQIIYENTGVMTTLLRFPGGGSNLVSKNAYEGIMTILTKAVRDAGFQYFDWNVDSDDAGSARKTETVRDNVIEGIRQAGTCIVLQHDIHPYSVDAVEEIIQWGLKNGYRFEAICESTPGFHHDVLN